MEQTHESSFKQAYRCFPLSDINKSHLEAGNRIIMPPSALDRLAFMEVEYPLLFEIENPASGQVSHCGVLEFNAEEGFIFLPNWMMKNIKLVEGELVIVRKTSPPKGTYMKIQPHTMKFTSLTNPKAVLEKAFRDFACMTIGDTTLITHNQEEHYLDMVETTPSNAISVVETDCEVEFAQPLDYKEPEKK
ncbi:uncharacterized protein LOC132293109 [Cornus florida]|uniref:uncharacterized protein LOC132293109 n=1 Tax=Cornus florida TaxID=4283 RepID=UPI0028A24962|nr:uncharacterized protein LOC132293109 [Cornus florida]